MAAVAGSTHPPHLSNPLRLDHAPHPHPGTLGLDAKVDFLGAVAEGLRGALELLRAGMVGSATNAARAGRPMHVLSDAGPLPSFPTYG